MKPLHSESPGRRLFRYALPSVFGMLIVSIQTSVDGLFVAKGVGPVGLAAINLSMPLINVMLSVAIMIVSGGVVLTGIAQGQGDEHRVRGYTTLTLVVLVTTVLVMSSCVAIGLGSLCRFLGADDTTYPLVRRYLGIIGCGFLFYCIPNFTEAFTRLRGRPNMVFLSGSICFVVNVILDYFFVLRFGWGVSGAAIATCIANSSAAIVLAPNVKLGVLTGNLREVGLIFYNGSSEMLTSVSAAITMYVFNRVLMTQYGPTGVAALTIVSYLNLVVNMSIFGLSQALYPLMSYQLGAGNYAGIRRLLTYSLLFSAGIGWGVYLLCLIFKHPIIATFADGDVTLTTLASTATTYVTLHYLISFINIVGSSFHTAVARPLESAVIALCRSIIFVLIPLALLVPRVGDMGVWLSMPIAETLTLTVSIPLTIHTLQVLKRKLSPTDPTITPMVQ